MIKSDKYIWRTFIVSTFIGAVITNEILSWLLGIACWSIAIYIGTNF